MNALFLISLCLFLIVSTYGSATEALKVLREGKDAVDIVLSDVHMPDMDGFKLLEAVGLDLNIPVISKYHYSDIYYILCFDGS